MQQVRPKSLRVITGGHRRGQAAPIRKPAIANQAISHTYSPSLAAHLVEDGYDIRTTMTHVHVLNRGGQGVRSPAKEL